MGAPGAVKDAGATAAGMGAEQLLESGHQDVVHDVAVDYYGKRLATCSSDRLIKLFALGAGDVPSTPLATLSGHDGPVWQVAWAHPKFGSILASCSYDRRVIVWREGAENEWHQEQVLDCSSLHSLFVIFALLLLLKQTTALDSILRRFRCDRDRQWIRV